MLKVGSKLIVRFNEDSDTDTYANSKSFYRGVLLHVDNHGMQPYLVGMYDYTGHDGFMNVTDEDIEAIGDEDLVNYFLEGSHCWWVSEKDVSLDYGACEEKRGLKFMECTKYGINMVVGLNAEMGSLIDYDNDYAWSKTLKFELNGLDLRTPQREFDVSISYKTYTAYTLFADYMFNHYGIDKMLTMYSLVRQHNDGIYKRSWCMNIMKNKTCLSKLEILSNLDMAYYEDLETYTNTYLTSAEVYNTFNNGNLTIHLVSNAKLMYMADHDMLVKTHKGYYMAKDVAKLYANDDEAWYTPKNECYDFNEKTKRWNKKDTYAKFKDGLALKKDIVTNADGSKTLLHAQVLAYHDFNWDDAKHYYQSSDDHSIKMGIEIETQGNPENSKYVNRYSQHFHCENDCSLAYGNSFEIISNPMTINYWKSIRYSMIDPLFDTLKEHGQTNGNSGYGLHVHINKADFKDWESVCYFIHNVQANKRDIERIARRQDSGYYSYNCRGGAFSPLELAHDPSLVENYFDGHDTCVNTHYDAYRYDNMDEFMADDGTIEIRVFKSTLDTDTLYSTLKFVENLVNISNEHSTDTTHLFDGLRNYALDCGVSL